MPVCCAPSCKNRSDETVGISYHKFPLKNEKLTREWIDRMGRANWYPTKYSSLCSQHFEEKYMYRANEQRRLLAQAVPTIFSFSSPVQWQIVRIDPIVQVVNPLPSNKRCQANSANIEAEEPSRKKSAPTPRKKKRMPKTEKNELELLVQQKEQLGDQNIEGQEVKSSAEEEIMKGLGLEKKLCAPNRRKSKRVQGIKTEKNELEQLVLQKEHLGDQNIQWQEVKSSTEEDIIKGHEKLCTFCAPNPFERKRVQGIKTNKSDLGQPPQRKKKRKQKVKSSAEEELKKGLKKKLCTSGKDILNSCFPDMIGELLELQASSNELLTSDSVRKFAMMVYFHSAQAYEYVRRKIFKLPHPNTLIQWASTTNGNPGFTEENFAKMQQEVESSSEPIFGALVFDEMPITKDTVWDGKQICGYVDLGHGNLESDGCEVATEALVFMVSALNRNWKLPVGYCFVNGLSRDVKLNLVLQYLWKLHETGIKIVATVCDGSVTNRHLFESLGIKFSGESPQCSFPNPSDPEQPVFCFLDAAYIIKMIRNLLANQQILIDGTSTDQNNKIKWEYLGKLIELLKKEHDEENELRSDSDWEKLKLKILLAAETLSTSVANSLQFCKDAGLKQFDDCDSTICFIRAIGSCFDMLDSCHPMGERAKCPINKTDKPVFCDNQGKSIDYLKGLKLSDGTLLCNSVRSIGISALVFDLLSVQGLAETYVWAETSTLKYLLTRRLSHVHLELLFSSIRNSCVDSSIPNAAQFKAAYRNCLIRQRFTSANDSVVLNPKMQVNPKQNVGGKVYQFDHEHDADYESLTMYSDQVEEYISRGVVRRISKVINCVECLDALQSECTKGKSVSLRCNLKPSNGIEYLCKIAEKVYRCNVHLVERKGIDVIPKLQIEVLSMLKVSLFAGSEHLFTATEHGEASHYVILIKLILKTYYTCRLHHVLESKKNRKIKQHRFVQW